MIERPIESHHADVFWIELGVGGAELAAVGEPEEVQLALTQCRTHRFQITRDVRRVEMTEQRPAQLQAALTKRPVMLLKLREGGLVTRKPRHHLVPDGRVTAHWCAGANSTRIHSDDVENGRARPE